MSTTRGTLNLNVEQVVGNLLDKLINFVVNYQGQVIIAKSKFAGTLS